MLSDEVRLVLSARNLASEQIDAVVASLKQVEQQTLSVETAGAKMTAGMLNLDASFQRVQVAAAAFADVQGRVTSGVLTGTEAMTAQAAAVGRLESAMASYQTRQATMQATMQAAAGITPMGGVAGSYGPFAPTLPADITGAGGVAGTYGPAIPWTTPEAQQRASMESTGATIAANEARAQAQVSSQNLQYELSNMRTNALIQGMNRTVGAGFTESPEAMAAREAGIGASAAGGAGLGSAMMGGLGSSMLYGAGFAAMYGLAQEGQQAVQTGLTAATLQSSTNLTADQVKEIVAGIQQLIQSGQSTFTQQQLLQGAYSIASVLPKSANEASNVMALLGLSNQSAVAFQAPDVASQTAPLITVMQSFGVPPSQMAQQAVPYENVLFQTALQGNVAPATLAPAFATFASTAASNRASLPALGAMLAFGTNEGFTAQQSGQDIETILRDITNPQGPQRSRFQQLGINVSPGNIAGETGIQDFFSNLFRTTGQAGPEVQAQWLGKLFDANAQPFVEAMAQQWNNVQQLMGVQQQTHLGPSVSGAAATTVLTSPAGQFDVEMRKFEDHLQQLGTALLPNATAAIQALGLAIEKIPDFQHWLISLTNPPATEDSTVVNAARLRQELEGRLAPTAPSGGAYSLPPTTVAGVATTPNANFTTNTAATTMFGAPVGSQALAPWNYGAPPGLPIPLTLAQTALAGGVAPSTNENVPSERFSQLSQGLQRITAPRGLTQEAVTLQSMRDIFRTDILQGDTQDAQAQLAQIAAFEQQNATALYPNDPNRVALDIATLTHQLGTRANALAATGPILAAQQAASFGDPRAAFGGAVARLSGEQREDQALHIAQEQLQAANRAVDLANRTIDNLRQQLTNQAKELVLLGVIATNSKAGASNQNPPQGGRGGMPMTALRTLS